VKSFLALLDFQGAVASNGNNQSSQSYAEMCQVLTEKLRVL
jgi:hypothetical protein